MRHALGPIHRHAVIKGEPFGGPPFTLNAVDSPFLGGTIGGDDLYEAGFFADDFDSGLGLAARKLFEAWRRKPIERASGPMHGVGGQLHRLILTAEGPRLEAVGHWLDPIGEPIRPRMAMMLPWVAGKA